MRPCKTLLSTAPPSPFSARLLRALRVSVVRNVMCCKLIRLAQPARLSSHFPMAPEMTLCPQCFTMNTAIDTGFSQISCTKGEEPDKPCHLCLQFSDLEQRTEKVKAELENLRQQSLQLRTKFNHHHDPFIHRLPPEVSSRIFLFCLPTRHLHQNVTAQRKRRFADGARPIQFVIGAVCQRWREIAWSTPQLWNVLCLGVSRNTHPVRAQLVQSWLERSGQLPLYLRVSYDETAYQHADVVAMSRMTLRLVIDTLNVFVSRWKVLSLRMPNSLYPLLECQPETPIMLETLELEHCSILDFGVVVEPRKFSLGSVTPSPKSLTLFSLGLEAMDLKWDHLTTFKASEFHVVDCLELLRQAHQLERCSFNVITDEVTPVNEQDPQPVTNHSLQSLTVDFLMVGQFWENLSLPSLRRLDFDIDRLADFDHLLSFFRRSRCPLQVLSLSTSTDGREETLIRILQTLPSLQTLCLRRIRISDRFFECFRTPGTSAGVQMAEHFLPELQEFLFYGPRTFQWSSILMMTNHQRQSLEQQIQRPLLSLDISIRVEEDDHIDLDTLRKIDDIVKRNESLDLAIEDDEGNNLISSSRRFHRMDFDDALMTNSD